MQIQNRCKSIFRLLLNVVMLTTASLIAILAAVRGWHASYAQVTDWCSQSPMPIWCTSHEEVINGNPVFTYTNNIPTGSNINGQSIGWFSATNGINGGALDRNDYNTTGVTRTYFYTSLPAIVTEASVSIPARSGETNSKRFVSLSSNRSTFSTTLVPADKSVGVFLSRKAKGGATDYTTGAYSNGLYFSAWYYFPQVYSSTTTSNDTLMVMEFMSEVSSGNWKVPWSIHLKKKTNGQMGYRVDERSASFSSDPTIADDLIQRFNQSSPDVPVNRWTHLEVFYKYAILTGTSGPTDSKTGLGNGQVIVFQDGIEIFRFDGVATQGTNSLTDLWLVASYSHLTTPAPFQFYVDDAAISQARLGAARELIRNGDFTNNGYYWRNDNPDFGSYTTDINAGLSVTSTRAAKLDITDGSGGLNDPNFYQPIAGGMRTGISYTLRFTAKSTTTRPIQAVIHHNGYGGGPFGDLNEIIGGDENVWTTYWEGGCGYVALSSSMQNFVCPITVTQQVTNGVLAFRVGNNASPVWIDNVSLVENENLIRNGDFEQSANWNFNNNSGGASYANVTGGGLSASSPLAAKVIITTSGASSYNVTLSQPLSTSMDSGITYTLRFSAKVKSGHTRSIRTLIQHNGGSWTPILLDWKSGSNCGEILLTQDVKNFSCTFQSSVLEMNPIVTFHLGQIDGNSYNWNTDVWIDNVSLSRSQ